METRIATIEANVKSNQHRIDKAEEKIEKLEEKLDIEDWDYISKFKTYIAVDISSFAEKWGKELVKKTVNIPKQEMKELTI